MQPRQRNPGNEIIVAIVALGALALSVVFAVVLTLGAPVSTATETPVANAERPTQDTKTQEPTREAFTATMTLTTMSRPATRTAGPSDTPRPTHIPATDTPDPRSTATRAATRTSPPSTPSRTPTPRPTRSATPFAQSGISAATASAVPTASRVPTETMRPSETPMPASNSPTETMMSPETSTPATALTTTASPTTCPLPGNWERYIVQPGNNLFRIALNFGTTMSRLQAINCIANPGTIEVGQILYVPPGSLARATTNAQSNPQPTGLATTSSARPPVIQGCTLDYIRITSPDPGAVLSGRVIVRGTATMPDPDDFWFYKVEIRPASATDSSYASLGEERHTPAPGPNNALTVINTNNFTSGDYLLRLTVVDHSGNYPEPRCTIRVTFP